MSSMNPDPKFEPQTQRQARLDEMWQNNVILPDVAYLGDEAVNVLYDIWEGEFDSKPNVDVCQWWTDHKEEMIQKDIKLR